MDVFGANDVGFLRAAAVAAGHELELFEALAAPRPSAELAPALGIVTGGHRLRALVDALVALGVIERAGEMLCVRATPARCDVPRAGWGLIADIVRRDRPLAVAHGDATRRFHAHLASAGAEAARELAPLLHGPRLVDLGGGAGTYTAAFLAAQPAGRATLVDVPDIIPIARDFLAPVADRVELVASEIEAARLCDDHDSALLANVLHLHGREACARLCEIAAGLVRPGGRVVIKDLRVDDGRAGPVEGLLFALNMAIYTDAGDVYTTSELCAWLAGTGLVDIEQHRLASSPNAIVVIGTRPARASVGAVDRSGPITGAQAGIEAELDARLAACDPDAAFPRQLRDVLAHALAIEREGGGGEREQQIVWHYCELMPRMRQEQLAGRDPAAQTLMHAPLRWERLPRARAAIDRLFRVLAHAGVATEVALGAADARQFEARTPSIAALYARTHYGGCMPLLYGYPADLAYFLSRGLSIDETIDRYLTAPLVHELCHLDRDRSALPPHLDECVAGWLGVHVWPEFAYPAPEHDDAIYAAPWLSQIGQAMVRVFGEAAVLRAHAGAPDALPGDFTAAARAHYWDDWRARRTLHFLSDTLDPRPWLALIVGGRRLAPDRDADRQIVADALRAMCLENTQVAGSFRTRCALPRGPIVIDGETGTVTTAARNALDIVPPSYWIPPTVTVRCEVTLGSLDEIPAIVERVVP